MSAWTVERVDTDDGPRIRTTRGDGLSWDLTPQQAEMHAAAVERLVDRFDFEPATALELLTQVEQTREACRPRDTCAYGECTAESCADGFCGPHLPDEVAS